MISKKSVVIRMSKQISVNIRMDDEVKEQADMLFGELGFTLTTAINAFVKQALREKAFPFVLRVSDLPSARPAQCTNGINLYP